VQAAILAHARTTPAVMIDPELAPIEIGQWLAEATRLDGDAPHPASWHLNYCEDLTSDIPAPSPELCASATTALDDGRSVGFVFAVAVAAATPDDDVRWLVRVPAVRKIRLDVQTPQPDFLDKTSP
jgi:hypothetical protein